ncbi:hypothetical protein C0995_009070 [Termitomyces sp. Mi166|nr:hypothetical protein C0995_009070 [Termitomyces sp. Mi166\
MLTLAITLAAKLKTIAGLAYAEPVSDEEIRDEDMDDSYMYAIMSSSMDPPLSAPHMTVALEVTGPAFSSSPLSVHAILDNGIPFLSAKKLVLDIEDNTAVDKHTGFDIVNLRHIPFLHH